MGTKAGRAWSLPIGCSARGADMGRRSIWPTFIGCWPVKLRLARVPMVDGACYDRWGAYWGNGGGTLYRVWREDEGFEVDAYFRAADRTAARAYVKERIPGARFYR
jgi:hypothetical protein